MIKTAHLILLALVAATTTFTTSALHAQRMPQDNWYLDQSVQNFGNVAKFDRPSSAALGPDGNLYVADYSNGLVQVFTQDGKFLRKWSAPNPWGICVTPDGKVYVSERNQCRIEVFDAQGNSLRTMGQSGNGAGQLNHPTGLCVDGSGNVYVADLYNNRIVVFDPSGGALNQWSTAGTNNNYSHPSGVAISGSTLYVVCDGGDAQIQKYATDGTFLGLIGDNSAGSYGITADASGNLYANRFDRLNVFDSSGTKLRNIGSFGSGNGQFQGIVGSVAVGNGKVFVPDWNNSRINVFQTDGTWLTNFGKQGNPASIAVGSGVSDAEGNLYFADSENSVIRKTDTNFALVATIGSRGSGEGQFGGNLSLTIAPSGKLIAVDQANNRVEIFNADGSFAKAFGKIGTTNGAFSIPWGVAAGRDGRIFVTDSANNRVQVFDADGNYLSKFGTKGNLDGQFNNPNHIASLPDGRIVVGDRGNSRLQFFDTNGAYLAQTGWNPEHFCVSADGGLYGSWGNIGFFDVARMNPVKEWGAGAPGPVTELPNGDLLHAGTDNVLRLWKRTYRLQAPANGLALPYPAIVNQVRRPGTTLVDIDYLVKDSDSANVTTAILAFKDGQNDLGSIIPMTTFVEGTAAKLGSNIPTGVTNRLTWNAGQDWSTNFGSIQFQVMAKDSRPLLNVDFINIPAVTNAVATNAPLKISRSPLTDTDLLSAWHWLIASKDPSISLSQGKVSSASGFSFTAPANTTQGLWRTRFNNSDWTGNSESSVVTSINFGTWDGYYSSYYVGMIIPASSGEYEFMISADDNAYWTLNGQSGTNNVAQRITLQAGVPVPLVIYYNNSGGGYSSMQVSWKPPGETGWVSVPDNVYSTAVAQPASSNYGDGLLTIGNTTTSSGRAFLFAKMGLREATAAEVTYARSAGMTNGTVNQWAPPLKVGPDERPAAVNSWGFDTGASGYWVVPITVTNSTP